MKYNQKEEEIEHEAEKNAYVVIPTLLWDNQQLPWKLKRLYGRIVSLTKKIGYCFASNEYLAKDIGCSIRTITNYLIQLKESGLINIDTQSQKGGGWRRKIFLSIGQEASGCLPKGKKPPFFA